MHPYLHYACSVDGQVGRIGLNRLGCGHIEQKTIHEDLEIAVVACLDLEIDSPLPPRMLVHLLVQVSETCPEFEIEPPPLTMTLVHVHVQMR